MYVSGAVNANSHSRNPFLSWVVAYFLSVGNSILFVVSSVSLVSRAVNL